MAESAAGRLPGFGPVFTGQVRYQLLLSRGPRALWAGVLLPVMLLVLTNLQQAHVAAAGPAGRAVLGVTLTAYFTHASGLVAAREAGVLKRWRASLLPRWCYLAVLGAWAVAALLASLRLFSWEPRPPRQRRAASPPAGRDARPERE